MPDILNEEADYPRKLPQLGDDNGRLVDAIGVDRWMGEWRKSVDAAVDEVLEIGVDRCIAALRELGVILDEDPWGDS